MFEEWQQIDSNFIFCSKKDMENALVEFCSNFRELTPEEIAEVNAVPF